MTTNISLNGVLLVDIGTPKELTREAVGSYLVDFLRDPYIVRAPRWIRETLTKSLIVPWRLNRSLISYQSVWTELGAPLNAEIQKLSHLLEAKLHQEESASWLVRYGYHFGTPSVASSLNAMKEAGVRDLTIVPLYPQWALSTRGWLEDHLKKLRLYESMALGGYGFERVSLTPPFYSDEGFIQAQSELLSQFLPKSFDDEVAVVFNFHGLPKNHIRAVVPDCKKCLKREGECRPSAHSEPYCYRFQCFETARAISENVGLFQWNVAFQSWLAPTRWLSPSLMEMADHFLEIGMKTMVVQSPSFVLDGVETLHGVNQELKNYFLKNGGENFIFVPALNHSPLWLEALQKIVLH